ncbi:hypothetical protein RQP46_001356 [Phenoliferia psychrophenolica]
MSPLPPSADLLSPGSAEAYFLPHPRGGDDSDTRTVVKFGTCKYATVSVTGGGGISVVATGAQTAEGYCLTKFEVKVADGGEDPRLQVSRIGIEAEFLDLKVAKLHLAIPQDPHYLGRPVTKTIEDTLSGSIGLQAFSSLLAANLAYERKTTAEVTKGIVINDVQSAKSKPAPAVPSPQNPLTSQFLGVIWVVNDTTGKGINLNIPVAIIVKHQPTKGFEARFVIKVRTKVHWIFGWWGVHTHTKEFIIQTDGREEAGVMDDKIISEFKTLWPGTGTGKAV